jgi:tetratricopeptide (TPR) repeat protein
MIRSILAATVLGILAAAPAVYLLSAPAQQHPAAALPGADSAAAEAAVPAEFWPICSSMGSLAESADWAALDPDFATGKRAIIAGDWKGAIKALASAGLRDDRNADIQNYLGYAYRRLRQFDPAMRHYEQALILNPRHRSAHEHLGEAYLVQGDLIKAEEHLAALERICLIPCDEYDDLKRAIAEYNKIARH